MSGSIACLFTRGSESVRLERREHADGRAELVVAGPGTELRSETFPSVPACMRRQSEIERTLMAEGYMLAHTTDRRRVPGDRRRISRTDRRKP